MLMTCLFSYNIDGIKFNDIDFHNYKNIFNTQHIIYKKLNDSMNNGKLSVIKNLTYGKVYTYTKLYLVDTPSLQ